MSFWDWFIRPFAEFAGSLALVAVLVLFALLVMAFIELAKYLRRITCKHRNCITNFRSHVICQSCGTNLGAAGEKGNK